MQITWTSSKISDKITVIYSSASVRKDIPLRATVFNDEGYDTYKCIEDTVYY